MIVFSLMSFIELINFLLLLRRKIELGEQDLNTALPFILLFIFVGPLGMFHLWQLGQNITQTQSRKSVEFRDRAHSYATISPCFPVVTGSFPPLQPPHSGH